METEFQKSQQHYQTGIQALNGLADRGYTIDFALYLQENCLVCHKTGISLTAEAFTVDEVYRFKSIQNPVSETIIIAVSGVKDWVKGFVVNTLGVYESNLDSSLATHLYSYLKDTKGE